MDGYFCRFSLKAEHLKNQTSYSIRSSMEEIIQKLQLSKKQLMWSNLNLKIFSSKRLVISQGFKKGGIVACRAGVILMGKFSVFS